MALLIQHFVEPPRACSYLPNERATLEHRLMTEVSPEELETLVVRGWRRFGPIYFRPACPACAECVSLRIPLDRFAPSESQKRALRRIRRFRVELGRPRVDPTRLALYAEWHHAREEVRGWEPSPLDRDTYFTQFAFPHPAGLELSLWDADRLVAVGLCDVTPRALSAVYFFYHPEIARLSPGVANVLLCAELARQRKIPHLYLGYRVLGCPSLRYKARYQPHELLVGRPGLEEEPRWIEAPSGEA